MAEWYNFENSRHRDKLNPYKFVGQSVYAYYRSKGGTGVIGLRVS